MQLFAFCKGHPLLLSKTGKLRVTQICVMLALLLKLHPAAAGAGINSHNDLLWDESGYKFLPIKGKVISADGTPVSGVSISVKGSQKGSITDSEGKFIIDVPAGSILIFTSVAFETREVKVGTETTIDVTLVRKVSSIDDVVVIGYGTQRKRNVTASTSSIKMDEISDIPTTNLASALAGQAAGLQSVVRTGAPGAPGGIQIRGTTSISTNINDAKGLSSPLYVIDGVPTNLEELAGVDVTNTDFLASLNMEDIESIDILKDASAAAIYGSRGANGVIVIKTKKGRTGKTRINFTSYAGVTQQPDPFKVYTGAAERRKKLEILRNSLLSPIDRRNGLEILAYATPLVLTDSLNPAFNNNYDYQGMYYRNGVTQSYFMDVSGGPEQSNYRISLGYDNDKGIVTATGFERYTLNASISNVITPAIKNDLRLRMAYMDRATGIDNLDPRRTFPVSPLEINSSLFYQTESELALLSGQLNDLYNKNRNTEISLFDYFTVDFLKNFKFTTEGSAQMWMSRQNFFQPSYTRSIGQSFASLNRGLSYSLNVQPYLSYTKRIGDHEINGMGGYALNFRHTESEYASAENGPNDAVKVIQGFPRENTNVYSDISASSLISFYGRLGYTYKNRYLFNANFRREASSRFGVNSRWGDFPSVSAGWIVSDEKFFKPLNNTINFFKIRGSYGINGNQHTNDYLKYNAYNSLSGIGGLPTNRINVQGYGGISAVIPDYNQPSNNALSWEETRQWNIGTDISFLNDRINLTAEAYHKYTDGIVFDAQFPDYTGYSSSKGNYVDVVNMGWEVSLEAYIFPKQNKFTWSQQLFLGANTNYIASLPNGGRDYINPYQGYAYVQGQPTNLYYMSEYLGVVKDVNALPRNPLNGIPLRIYGDIGLALNKPSFNYINGLPLFTDVDGNYLIDYSDQKFIENRSPNPKMVGGFNTFLKFGNFSLRVLSNFSFGSWIYNNTLQRQIDRFNWISWHSRALYTLYEDYSFYREGNTESAKLPMLEVQYTDGGGAGSFRRSTMFLERGDYWKISDAIFAYTLPKKIAEKIGASQVQVTGSVSNVWQWQASDVPDATRVNARGEDYGDGYPMSRKYILGLRVNL